MAGERILVVDDNPDLLKMVALCLREAPEKYLVTCTNSGDDAIARLALDGHYDLVILDIRLPGKRDGNAVLDQMGMQPPVIVHTGSDEADIRHVGTKVRAVLRKPYELPVLLDAVRRAIRPPGATPTQTPLPPPATEERKDCCP